jgi:hypothetical protein
VVKLNRIAWSISGFFVSFGEISYFISNKKNTNDQEPGLILTGNGIEKCVMDKNVSLKKIITKNDEEPTFTRNIQSYQ